MIFTNKQRELFKIISDLAPIVLVTISLTRIWAISLFYIFGKDSQAADRIINDPWHHYQVGLVLVVAVLFFGRLKKMKLLFAIGLGIFLEEWPVFLNDFGLNTNYLYHTRVDFISIFALVGFAYILSKTFYSKVNPKNI